MTRLKRPAPEELDRRRHVEQGGSPAGRDTTPAVGRRGEPGRYRRAVEGAGVALARRAWGDMRWSFLYGPDTRYAVPEAVDGQVAEAARRARADPELPAPVQGPVIKPAVWTWEIPVYFWFGGIASGSSWVALACELTGDHASARTARRVTLAAAIPCAPLLISDLGRPARFLNMLRIFKPRSPMSMGAWCLAAFSNAAGAAVGADLLGRARLARGLGGAAAGLGLYLGSYTGALLACTAVPLWARSRLFLGPVFVSTALATGAAANRLVLAARGLRVRHPTRHALGTVETGAIAAELALSMVNQRRLGGLADPLEQGRPGRLFRFAKAAVLGGLALRLARRRGGPAVHHLASLLYLAAGLAFRFGWVEAGRLSAGDHDAVARAARAPVG